jgi:hypothetical protein
MTLRGPKLEPCPYCGGDESKCDFDFQSAVCSEMERQFADDGGLDEPTSGELAGRTDSLPLPNGEACRAGLCQRNDGVICADDLCDRAAGLIGEVGEKEG